jgi:hypothetical protein
MSGADEPGPRGRLLLVTATRAQARAALASTLASRLGHAVLVDGEALERAVVLVPDRSAWTGPPTAEQLRMRLLRWSAALAVAETYQLEGFDAVIAEDALGDRLEDLLDLVEPEPVHVVVVADEADPPTPRWGLWVESADVGSDAEGVAAQVVAHLEESRVLTTPPA